MEMRESEDNLNFKILRGMGAWPDTPHDYYKTDRKENTVDYSQLRVSDSDG